MNEPITPVIVWFRQDLRLQDNPALLYASQTAHPILPIYILDDHHSDPWSMGGASKWWLHKSLTALNLSLEDCLVFEKGDPLAILSSLIERTKAKGLYWNRCYEPWRIQRDTLIKKTLKPTGVEIKSFNGSLLFEPHEVLKKDGTPYRVFTPFYKQFYLGNPHCSRQPANKLNHLKLYHFQGQKLEELALMPTIDWHKGFEPLWQPGETGAHVSLADFLQKGLRGYQNGRNFPSQNNVSSLSPHLHFGEISPHQVWHQVNQQLQAKACDPQDGQTFLSQMVWRDFSHSLLFHQPDLPRSNLQKKFDAFEWHHDPILLKAWQQGQTGYPIVDAGMRQLWQTGYMHNRVRMIVGSFLVKNLLIHWHHGEDWFWDTLVDANLANNAASWQWIAGCGADAAPYFRIFNPITQGEKFDPQGIYVRQFVPELQQLPDKFIHSPWLAPQSVLLESNITLGQDYPEPIVDLKASRIKALAAYEKISNKQK